MSEIEVIERALIVLSGHLPLFSGDESKVARATLHLRLRDDAFDALDRIADRIGEEHVQRRISE